ncbi:MAG: esterase [Eubacterium sp.]|nr:esterase [Eubacterium sp.]
MNIHEFGKPEADIVLIWPVFELNTSSIENEINMIAENTNKEFRMSVVKVNDWNRDLSPWKAPAVFGKDDFGGGAADTLDEVKELCSDKSKTYFIGGYSLAGLFALWAAYQTDIFSGVAAASPSIWFPGFVDYMKANSIYSDTVYLSLGNKEEKIRNPVMSTVGDRICEAYDCLRNQNVNCTLEWDEGNHFKDTEQRTAKAFIWVLNNNTCNS